MQIPKKATVCQFFLKNKCTYGEKCKNIHPGYVTIGSSGQIAQSFGGNPQPMDNPYNPHKIFMQNYQYPNLNLCRFFKSGNCNKDNCSFYHGFSDTLQTLQTKKAHENEIIDLIAVNKDIFITYDERGFKAWKLDPQLEVIEEKNVEEGAICKLIFSNGRVIIASKIESMYGFIFQLFA